MTVFKVRGVKKVTKEEHKIYREIIAYYCPLSLVADITTENMERECEWSLASKVPGGSTPRG